MTAQFEINGRALGNGETYIVAELSANHQHDLENAIALVYAARDAGADAVKLQTYTADTLTIDSDNKYFQIGGGTLWDGRTLHDLYSEAFTPWEWHPRLQEVAHELGLDFFSTAFDPTAVDFLETLNVPVHKIASFELTDLGLIDKMARTGKPLILSTGMATLAEIEEAVTTARDAGATQIALLKCTSAYPSPPEAMNLTTIPDMVKKFGVVVGLSDHTLGTTVPVAAVALGACLVEKHFSLRRAVGGPDSAFSLEPHEFRAMVDAVRTTEKALGTIRYGAGEDEQKSIVFRRSLFVVQDMQAGEPFTPTNVRSVRPGYGLHTRHLAQVLGQRARVDIQKGTPLEWFLISEGNPEGDYGTH